MVSKKISQLPPTTSMNNADLMAVVQGGVTKKITGSDLRSSVLPMAQALIANLSSTGEAEALLQGQPPTTFVGGFSLIAFNSVPGASNFILPGGSLPPGFYDWDGSSVALIRGLVEGDYFLSGNIVDFATGDYYIGPQFWKVTQTGGGQISAASGMQQSRFSSYDPTVSGLVAKTVQAAIDEVAASPSGGITTTGIVFTNAPDIASAEASASASNLPAGVQVSAGYGAVIFNLDSNAPFFILPPGAVTPGIYDWDGTNLNFNRTWTDNEVLLCIRIVDVGASKQYSGPKVMGLTGIGQPVPYLVTVGEQSALVSYNNTASGLTATTVQAAIDEVVSSTVVNGGSVSTIMKITQAAYDLLSPPDPSTLYIVMP